MRHAIILLALLLLSATQQASELPLIKVSTNGTAKSLPDQASISIRFSSSAFEAETARKEVNKKLKPFLRQLEDFTLEENSLDSSQTRIYPQYEYHNKRRELTGYEVSRRVSFTLDQLDQLESLMTIIATNKASQLDRINFAVKHAKQLQDKALRKAINAAKRKAQKIAQGFDVMLGKIHSVTHRTANPGAPVMRAMAMQTEMADSNTNTYQQKELEYQSSIDVAFTFE